MCQWIVAEMSEFMSEMSEFASEMTNGCFKSRQNTGYRLAIMGIKSYNENSMSALAAHFMEGILWIR